MQITSTNNRPQLYRTPTAQKQPLEMPNSPREEFQPSTGLEWAALVGGRVALVSSPLAAISGLCAGALTGDAGLGMRVGVGVMAAGGLAGGALGLLVHHAFKDLNIPS